MYWCDGPHGMARLYEVSIPENCKFLRLVGKVSVVTESLSYNYL